MLKYITKNNIDILDRLVHDYGMADFYFYLVDNINVSLYSDEFKPIHNMDRYQLLRDLLGDKSLISNDDFMNIVRLSISEFDVYDLDELIKPLLTSTDGFTSMSIPPQIKSIYKDVVVSYKPNASLSDRLKWNIQSDTKLQNTSEVILDKH